jgi:hypothetical protein
VRKLVAWLRYAWYLVRPSFFRRHAAAWVRDRRGRRAYKTLSENELRAARRSDTAFVFGSGRSLVDVTPEEWERRSGSA